MLKAVARAETFVCPVRCEDEVVGIYTALEMGNVNYFCYAVHHYCFASLVETRKGQPLGAVAITVMTKNGLKPTETKGKPKT